MVCLFTDWRKQLTHFSSGFFQCSLLADVSHFLCRTRKTKEIRLHTRQISWKHHHKAIIHYWIFTRDVTSCIHEVSHTSNAWYAALESAQAYNDHSFRWYDIKRHHQYYWLLGVLVCLIMEMLTNRTHYTVANYYFSMSK